MSLSERDALREQMIQAWQKAQTKAPLSLVESQIIDALAMHPEYHPLFNNPTKLRTQEFRTDNNPFLHISLHISLSEQIKLNRPAGIQQIHQQYLLSLKDPHEVAHRMMDVMAHVMWDAQQAGTVPSDQTYIEKLKEHLSKLQ